MPRIHNTKSPNGLMKEYALLERLLNEEKLYLDRDLSFGRICGWLRVSEQRLNGLLRQELGLEGEELLAALRSGESARLKLLYGIGTED